MLFPTAWSVQHRQSLKEQRRALAASWRRRPGCCSHYRGSLRGVQFPQAQPVDINVVMTITTACLIMWQANMLPTKLLQGHNLASTSSTTGIFGEVQEEKPSMSREELLGSNHGQSLSEDFKQTRMDRHTDFLFPSYLEEEAIEWSTQMLQQRGIVEMFPDGWCPTPAFITEQASSKLRSIKTPRAA